MSEELGLVLDLVKSSLSSSPYPGLRPFQRDESDIFFGREEQTDELLAKLQRCRFLAVVGPSGCGKSSLVRAGLMAALEAGFMTDAGAHWRMAEMRPGEDPLVRLGDALLAHSALGRDRVVEPEARSLLIATLRGGPLGLVEVLRERPLAPRSNLFILVDQFEEIFRFRDLGNIDRADAFVSLLLASAQQREVPVYIVITMRSDFLGDCALFAGLPEAINDGQYLTPRLTREQIRSAIVGPARVFDVDVEPALVNQLLNEMGPDPDQLPLLQHLMMRLWLRLREKQRVGADVLQGSGQSILTAGAGAKARATITVQDNAEVGTFSRALSVHADEVFGQLNETQQIIAEAMFRRLTERGLGKRDTRRPARLSRIAAVAGVSVEEVKAVAEEFRREDRSFVTPPEAIPLLPDTILDIGHESLIRQWKRLNEWVDEEARSAEGYRRIKEAALLWKGGDADPLGGINLERALAWKRQQNPTAAWASRYGTEEDFEIAMQFLQISELQWVEEVRRVEAQRRRSWLVRVTPIALALLVAMTFLTVYAFRQKGIASKAAAKEAASARTNFSRKLAAQAISESREGRLDLALLLSEKAVEVSDTFEARRSLFNILQSSPITLLYDQAGVNTVAFSPDGKTIASGGDNGEVRLRDLGKLTQEGSLLQPGNDSRVLSIAFSPDRKLLASGSSDNNVRIWDATSGNEIRKLEGHSNYVLIVAFSPDGKFLASAGKDNTVLLWDVATWRLIDTLRAHRDFVSSVAFSPDSQLLATAGKDNAILIWDVKTRRQLGRPLLGHKSGVNSVAFSPDGSLVASGADDNTVVLWDLKTRVIKTQLSDHTAAVTSIAFSPDGKLVASGSDDRTVLVHDVSTGNKHGSTLGGHNRYVSSVAFSPDGRLLADASADNIIQLWDVSNDQPLSQLLAGEAGAVYSAAFSPDGRLLATGGEDGVRLWNVEIREEMSKLPSQGVPVWAVAFSRNGEFLAAGRYDGTIQLWDIRGREPVTLWDGSRQKAGDSGPDENRPIFASIAFSPDGKTLACGSYDNTVHLWEVSTRRQLAPLVGHTNHVRCVAFNSPDGNLLASASDDGTVRLWDVASHQLVDTPSDHKEPVWCVAFDPEGRTLASGSLDKTIRLWDVRSRESVGFFTEPTAESVQAIAFSSDGKTLAVGGGYQLTSIWDLTERALLGKIGGHPENAVRAVAFSPDHRLLAIGCIDGSVRLIDVNTDSWRQRAQSIANRNLTDDEVFEYLK
ncbi:MAG TPA: hypothetical protein VGV87_28630 [Blastocatellia bacterium]|nr:hypothetical protein [Blastocatellia bacterium]